MEQETHMIMASLSTLSPPQFSDLTHSLFSQTLHHDRRLSSLLSSPYLFSLTLRHLHSLSLPHKTLLIAKHLLSSLHHLARHFHPPPQPPPLQPFTAISHRDLDATLLLLLLCDVHQRNPEILKTPRSAWRGVLSRVCSDTMLTQSGIGVHYGGTLLPYLENLTRCWRFINAMGGGRGNKQGRELAAARAVVVSLPTVEVKSVGEECVICREEMRIGRDVCELPCEHLFHWMCILPWLKKRNTCPCCRFQLPTEDVFGEIGRLWSFLIKMGSGGSLNNGTDC